MLHILNQTKLLALCARSDQRLPRRERRDKRKRERGDRDVERKLDKRGREREEVRNDFIDSYGTLDRTQAFGTFVGALRLYKRCAVYIGRQRRWWWRGNGQFGDLISAQHVCAMRDEICFLSPLNLLLPIVNEVFVCIYASADTSVGVRIQ